MKIRLISNENEEQLEKLVDYFIDQLPAAYGSPILHYRPIYDYKHDIIIYTVMIEYE